MRKATVTAGEVATVSNCFCGLVHIDQRDHVQCLSNNPHVVGCMHISNSSINGLLSTLVSRFFFFCDAQNDLVLFHFVIRLSLLKAKLEKT